MLGTLSGNFIVAIADILNILLELYMWTIIIAAVISWVSPDPYNPIVRFLFRVTEPALRPIRRLIGHSLGPLDISPLIVVLIIIFLQKFVVSSLFEIGYKIK